MKLGSERTLEGLKPVLKDPNAFGPDLVYWVFSEVSGKWANITIIVPDKIGDEFPKTFGHYHGIETLETYHIIEGEGILQLQKKHLENGKIIESRVEEVIFVKAKAGDEVVITPVWGHSWSNVSDKPLVTYDDWRSGHDPSDYEFIRNMQGLAYYLVSDNGEVKAIPNPRYQNLPEPVWMSASEFASKL